MEKMQYFRIKSKIYYYLLVVLGIVIAIILLIIGSILTIGELKVENQEPVKMMYKGDNAERLYDIPVYMNIKSVSKVLFYQKPEQHKGRAFYLEVTDTDDNKFIMRAAYDNEVEKAIEIKETLAQNENNEDFFIHAVGTTDALTSSVLKSIKKSSNSSLSLEELREKYGYFLFALDRKKIGKGTGLDLIIYGTILTILVYYFISSNLKFETARKSIGYTKRALVQEWQSVDTKFRICNVYLGEKVIFSTEGCVLYSDILYVYEGTQNYAEDVLINPGNLVTAELKNGKRVKIGKWIFPDRRYPSLTLPLIAQIKENMAKVQQQ